MRPRSALLLLFAMPIAACSSGSGGPTSIGGGPSFVLDFSSEVVRPGSGAIPEPSVDGRTGEIFAVGAIGADFPCFDVDGSADLAGERLTLTVTASSSENCAADVDTVAYEANIRELQAGSYRFLLVHVGSAPTDTVLDRDVEVE